MSNYINFFNEVLNGVWREIYRLWWYDIAKFSEFKKFSTCSGFWKDYILIFVINAYLTCCMLIKKNTRTNIKCVCRNLGFYTIFVTTDKNSFSLPRQAKLYRLTIKFRPIWNFKREAFDKRTRILCSLRLGINSI